MNHSKYMDIVIWTKEQIAAGAFLPGDRFLSESALCERFGYSRQTVRRGLEALERDGHVSRIQGSGTYITAYQPRPRRPFSGETVGILSVRLDDSVFPAILGGIEATLAQSGYGVYLASSQNQAAGEARALHFLLDANLAGLIVEPTRSGLPCLNLDLYAAVAERGVPLVCINAAYSQLSFPYVALDDEKAGYIATRHLLEMGHRKIAAIFSHSERSGHLRCLGFARALAEKGIFVQDENIHWYSAENLFPVLSGDSLRAVLDRCTAAVCQDDPLALALMETLRAQGRRVPEEVSLVGVNDGEAARIAGLTSVAHPAERLGEAAAKLLLSMIGGAPGKNILIPPTLVVRQSAVLRKGDAT